MTKNRLELIPPSALLAMGRALTFGASKHAPASGCWAKEPIQYYGSALRHLVAWNAGEKTDPESGLSHLDHALANLAILEALSDY